MAENDNFTPDERDEAPDEALRTAYGCMAWGCGVLLLLMFVGAVWFIAFMLTRPA